MHLYGRSPVCVRSCTVMLPDCQRSTQATPKDPRTAASRRGGNRARPTSVHCRHSTAQRRQPYLRTRVLTVLALVVLFAAGWVHGRWIASHRLARVWDSWTAQCSKAWQMPATHRLTPRHQVSTGTSTLPGNITSNALDDDEPPGNAALGDVGPELEDDGVVASRGVGEGCRE